MIDFQNALANNDLNTLKKIPKTDIHNHAITSCRKEYLIKNGIKLSDEKTILHDPDDFGDDEHGFCGRCKRWNQRYCY